MREGSYSLPDGRQVRFTDADTLQEVLDLYQYIEHDYKGSDAIDAKRLEDIISRLGAGAALGSIDWDILDAIKQKAGSDFEKWQNSGKDGQDAAIPEGSGRIQESNLGSGAAGTAPISPQSGKYDGTPSTTKLDKEISTAHLLDSVLHDLGHTRQHILRILQPDVKKDKQSTQFNAEHALHHAESAQDHAKKLDNHLAETPTNPKVHKDERDYMQGAREAERILGVLPMAESKVPPPPNLKVSSSDTTRCGTCTMFYLGHCWGYGNIHVERDWICDSFSPEISLVNEAVRLNKLREDSKPTICIDFDGVIYDRSNEPGGSDLAGKLIKGTPEALHKLAQQFRLVCLTARPNVPMIRKWLDDHNLGSYFADVTNHKPSAAAYVDNRSLMFKNWAQTVSDLEKGDKSPYSSDVPGGKT